MIKPTQQGTNRWRRKLVRWIALAGCGLMLLCSKSTKEKSFRPWTDVKTKWSAIACALFSDSGFVFSDVGKLYGGSFGVLDAHRSLFDSLFRFKDKPLRPHDPVIVPGMWSVLVSEWGTDFEGEFWAEGTRDGVFRYILLVGNGSAPWKRGGRVTMDILKEEIAIFVFGYYNAHYGFDGYGEGVLVAPPEFPFSMLESFCISELVAGHVHFEDQGGAGIFVELDLVGHGIWREAVFETQKIPGKHKFVVNKGNIELHKSFLGKDFVNVDVRLLMLFSLWSIKDSVDLLRGFELPGDRWLSTKFPDSYKAFLKQKKEK